MEASYNLAVACFDEATKKPPSIQEHWGDVSRDAVLPPRRGFRDISVNLGFDAAQTSMTFGEFTSRMLNLTAALWRFHTTEPFQSLLLDKSQRRFETYVA